MALNTKDFNTLVSEMITAIQAGTNSVISFVTGSIMRAWVEACASVTLWLQYLILQVLALTRASTSNGDDLDSWMADFDLTRLPAITANGVVFFSRFSTIATGLVPLGTTVASQDGSKRYTVIAGDSPNYNPGLGGYVLSIGNPTVGVLVQATAVGSASNAIVGEINTITTAVSGIDTVSNLSAIISGMDVETDAAFRLRFVVFMASLRRATMAAIAYAIDSVQVGIKYSITENYDYEGALKLGYFYVVVDDGSGAPSVALRNSIRAAVDAMRPLCSQFDIYAPVIVPADVAMSITVTTGDGAIERAAVQTAITNFLNSLSLGVNGQYTLLSSIAYGVSTNIINVVPGYTLNGALIDLSITNKQTIKAGSVVIS